ncbi:hypothetical protein HispidOSU_030994 [Sigmodon hispidus]
MAAGWRCVWRPWVPVAVFITTTKMSPCHQHEEEIFYLNSKGQKETLPSIRDSPVRGVEGLVPMMMDEALNYLEKRQTQDSTFTYEVIVVDEWQ